MGYYIRRRAEAGDSFYTQPSLLLMKAADVFQLHTSLAIYKVTKTPSIPTEKWLVVCKVVIDISKSNKFSGSNIGLCEE